jgi:hypothetical protein
MPVEIRELVIKATITQDNAAGGPQASPATPSGNAASSNEQVINTCVEKIMEILKTKNQR